MSNDSTAEIQGYIDFLTDHVPPEAIDSDDAFYTVARHYGEALDASILNQAISHIVAGRDAT